MIKGVNSYSERTYEDVPLDVEFVGLAVHDDDDDDGW